MAVKIRRMRTRDIPFAIKLTDQENWGVTRPDLQRILALNPNGSFIAYEGSRKIGLTTTIIYGRKLAWIGNVIVDRSHRGKHIGRSLVELAVKYLQKLRVDHIGLYCFNRNIRFYRQLDFRVDAPFIRAERRLSPKPAIWRRRKPDVQPFLDQILKLDKEAFGVDRSRLIHRIISDKAGWFAVGRDNSKVRSYLLVKEYRDGCELGPWVHKGKPARELQLILSDVFSRIRARRIEITCLRTNTAAVNLIERSGFRTVQQGVRMYLDERPVLGDDRWSYALGFLDKG